MKKLFFGTSLLLVLLCCSKKDVGLNLENADSNVESITLSNGLVFIKDGDFYRMDDMLYAPSMDTKGVFMRNGVNGVTYWPNGEVYYEFDENASQELISNAVSAMEELSTTTGVHFTAATSNTPNRIHFQCESVNNSYVGMRGGVQPINIYNDTYKYIIMHEILHALGVFHEQSRSDRDDYITVNWDNIKTRARPNFYKKNDSEVYNIGSFNFESIMLYPSIIYDPDFVYDYSLPAMTKLDGSCFVANRSYLSYGDIRTVKAIYGHPYIKMEENIEIIQDFVNGPEEIYEANHEWRVSFYEDADYSIPTISVVPRHMVLRKEARSLGNHGEIVTTVTQENATIPAGVTSYVVREARNREFFFCSDPYLIEYEFYRVISTD